LCGGLKIWKPLLSHGLMFVSCSALVNGHVRPSLLYKLNICMYNYLNNRLLFNYNNKSLLKTIDSMRYLDIH
jgi:hypothetical protein